MKLHIDTSDIDIDRHGQGCQCGACNFNGKSYGVAIKDSTGEVQERMYACSEESAINNARLQLKASTLSPAV